MPVIRYRTFRNTDPPALAAAWNQCCTSRGAFPLRSTAPLEFAVFSKPYFDAKGLIVAEEEGQVVGFAHAGFGPDAAENSVNRDIGVICALMVVPGKRRIGIGAELLRQAESYLTNCGVVEIVAGQVPPITPFYFGVYGNANLPGFLKSDALAAPFFEKHGYERWNTTLVFERQLPQMEPVVDGRFVALRRRYDAQLVLGPQMQSWWQDCKFGPIEPAEFRLVDKLTTIPAARCLLWEMHALRNAGNPIAGLLELQVRPEMRRNGLARFMLSMLMRYLQERYFRTVEIQCEEDNDACIRLLQGLGFENVDVGHSFRKSAGQRLSPSSNG